MVIQADLTAQVDPNEVAQAITALRENESAKQELVALRAETDQLHQQLDAANQALTTAVSPDQVQTLNQQRQDLLNQLQTNALVSQAWTDWVYVTPIVYPYPWIGLQQVHGLLLQARQLNPQNRHLRILQQVVTVPRGAVPSTPVPGLSPPLPPHTSLLVPPLASQQLAPSPRQSQPLGSSPPAPGVREASPSTTLAPNTPASASAPPGAAQSSGASCAVFCTAPSPTNESATLWRDGRPFRRRWPLQRRTSRALAVRERCYAQHTQQHDRLIGVTTTGCHINFIRVVRHGGKISG